MDLLVWVGIFFCLSQSALMSGLNLGLFSLSKLELKVEARNGNLKAKKLLKFRENANFALVTILWGNVGVNVLLALLSGSILSGIVAFLFSTFVITFFAEIMPQAYFSRNALKMAFILAPLLQAYQFILYPIAKPSAWLLDFWLGGEEIRFFREQDLRHIIRLHMEDSESDIDIMEGQGALNFLEIDDVYICDEGEVIDPKSIIQIEFKNGSPAFPEIKPSPDDQFLRKVNMARKRWAILIDDEGEPRLAIKADDFIREAIFSPERFNPFRHCHRPIIARNEKTKLGETIQRFVVRPQKVGDDIVENDLILLWGEETKRIITGSDILGRLLRGIVRRSTIHQ